MSALRDAIMAIPVEPGCSGLEKWQGKWRGESFAPDWHIRRSAVLETIETLTPVVPEAPPRSVVVREVPPPRTRLAERGWYAAATRTPEPPDSATWPSRDDFAAMSDAEINAFLASRGLDARVQAEPPDSGRCLDCGLLRSEPGVPAICAGWHHPVVPEAPPPDALRACAEAVLRDAEPDESFEGEFIDYLVPVEALDALRAALAATLTPEPPDLAAILDEMEARIAEDVGKVPRSGWMTAEQIKQRGSLRGQSAAVGWLRNRLGLRSGSPAPEGGE